MLNDKLAIMKAAGETEMKSSDELNYAKMLETLALVILRRGRAAEAEMTSQEAVDIFGKLHCTLAECLFNAPCTRLQSLEQDKIS